MYNNDIITCDLYIPKIKLDGVWMGDIEISVIHIIYDCILYLFEIDNNFKIQLINIYGEDTDINKKLLNLCFVNNNHFVVLYEKNRKTNILSEINWFETSYLKNDNKNILLKTDINSIYKKNLQFNTFTYANDNGLFKYKEVINYILKKNAGERKDRYPQFIYKISPRTKRKNLKKRFRAYCKKFSIDPKTNRLQRSIKSRDIYGNYTTKKYYIAFYNEKKSIIENLHILSCHRGINTLYNLVWKNIFYDLKSYIKNCPICEQIHKNIYKKPPIKQILTNFPKERYVADLIEIDKDIDDSYQRYKYILNIIDHFTIYTGCYLLEKKNATETLYGINEFILRNGKPKILQTDNGREFCNNRVIEYCENMGIELIHSSPRHPSTNGVVERVHQNIRKALLAIKTEKKINMILGWLY